MKQVFVTGITGTIGSEVVRELLREPGTTVLALVRARGDAELQQRMEALFAYWEVGPEDPARRRVQALRGDITLPLLGLDETAQQRVAQSTHFIHCAASVKLNMSLEQARATAVQPTRSVLELARRAASAGALRKVDLVSTVGVWGRNPGVLPERPVPEVTAFHNTYEAAKWEAERVVWSEARDLPVTVLRPSMVVGATGSGRVIHFQVFYHLCEFLCGRRTFGVMPQLGHTRLDIVPVDWVARVLCWSSASPEMAGRVLHLCAGPEGSMALTQLQQRVRDAWGAHGIALPGLKPVDRRWLLRLVPLLGAVSGARLRRALKALPPMLEYLAEDQAFGNADTTAALAGAGLQAIAAPQFLAEVLDFYLASARP